MQVHASCSSPPGSRSGFALTFSSLSYAQSILHEGKMENLRIIRRVLQTQASNAVCDSGEITYRNKGVHLQWYMESTRQS
jgi:hypothetical protein